MLAPASTPNEVIAKLNKKIIRSLALPDVKGQMAQLGLEIVGSSPGQFAIVLKKENARWSKMIRDLGLRAE